MDAERHKARWRKRRIIYNNDGDDVIEARSGMENEHDVAEGLMVRRTGDTVQDFLDTRSTPLIGSQVDSNWFASAMAGVTFSHHTKLGGFYGEGVPLELVEKYGRDALQVQLDFSHENGMEAAWALRMNDVHDSYPPGSRRWNYGLAKFKRDNPEYMMREEPDWDNLEHPENVPSWSGLDFAIPQVRDHIFAIIEEVAENYDVDLIGMEFFKYFPFFRESLDGSPVEPEHLEMMNDLLRRIRRMADDVASRRGRPLLLAAHTPFSLEDSVHVGVDLETWLKEGLIDQFCPGGNMESVFRDSYTDIIALGHKYEVPVYPCVSWAFWDRWVFLGHSEGKYRGLPRMVGNPLRGAARSPRQTDVYPGVQSVGGRIPGLARRCHEHVECRRRRTLHLQPRIGRSAVVAGDRRGGDHGGKRQTLRHRPFRRSDQLQPPQGGNTRAGRPPVGELSGG